MELCLKICALLLASEAIFAVPEPALNVILPLQSEELVDRVRQKRLTAGVSLGKTTPIPENAVIRTPASPAKKTDPSPKTIRPVMFIVQGGTPYLSEHMAPSYGPQNYYTNDPVSNQPHSLPLPYYKPQILYYTPLPSTAAVAETIATTGNQVENEDEVGTYCLQMTKKAYKALTVSQNEPQTTPEPEGNNEDGGDQGDESVKRVNEIKEEIAKLNQAAQKLIDNQQQRMHQDYLAAEKAASPDGMGGYGYGSPYMMHAPFYSRQFAPITPVSAFSPLYNYYHRHHGMMREDESPTTTTVEKAKEATSEVERRMVYDAILRFGQENGLLRETTTPVAPVVTATSSASEAAP